MTLIKTSILTAVSTAIKVLNGLVVVKIIAMYIGPAGLALIGSFQNFTSVIMTFSTATTTGLIKYTADYQSLESKRKLWSTVIRLSFITTFLISLGLFLFNVELSIYFFKDIEYKNIFTLFSITLIMFTLNAILLAIINGQKEIVKLTKINIFSSFIGLFLTGSLAYFYGLYGALVSYVIGQSIVLTVTIFFIIKLDWFRLNMFTDKLDKDELKKLSHYILMAFVSALTIPISLIFIRNYITDSISLTDAGYWEAMWRISSTFIMFITTILTVYYLPKLSSIKDTLGLKNELHYVLKMVMPTTIIATLIIYLLKDYIILILFTEDFKVTAELFLFQLVGDVFKIGSFVIGYLMIAKSMTKMYVVIQIIFTISLVVLSVICIDIYGLIGVTIAYCINYLFLCIVMIYLFRHILFYKVVKYEK